jgi:hypothetical protein
MQCVDVIIQLVLRDLSVRWLWMNRKLIGEAIYIRVSDRKSECSTVFHHVYMSVRGRIPTCDLIGRLFLGSGLQRNNRPIKLHVGFGLVLTCKHDGSKFRSLQILWSIALKLQIGKDERNRNIKNIFIKLQMGTNIMANQVKTPIQLPPVGLADKIRNL